MLDITGCLKWPRGWLDIGVGSTARAIGSWSSNGGGTGRIVRVVELLRGYR